MRRGAVEYLLGGMAYDREVAIVQEAIVALQAATDRSLYTELEREQRAAGTGLEYYGITKTTFERFLTSSLLDDDLAQKLRSAVQAVGVMYGGAI